MSSAHRTRPRRALLSASGVLALVVGLVMLVCAGAATSRSAAPEVRHAALQATYMEFAGIEGAYRFSRIPPWKGLDWRDNGCRVPPGVGGASVFYPACNQQDFCYRNVRMTGADIDAATLRCDRKLRRESLRVCRRLGLGRPCRVLANQYYRAVRRSEWPNF